MPVIIKGQSGQTHEFAEGYRMTGSGKIEIEPGYFDPKKVPGDQTIVLRDIDNYSKDGETCSVLSFYVRLFDVQSANPGRTITGEISTPLTDPFAKELANRYRIGWKDGGKNAGTG